MGLPKKDDVKQGCVAYKIAAYAADVALGILGTRRWDDQLTKARRPQLGEAGSSWPSTATRRWAYHDEDLDVRRFPAHVRPRLVQRADQQGRSSSGRPARPRMERQGGAVTR